MSTLALLLHEPAARKVRDWWDLLESELGLRGVRKVPFPHVTLFGCDGVDHPQIQEVLDDFCFHTPPLELRSIGVGLFTRPMPVIYAPIIRSQALSELHRSLWERIGTLGGRLFRLYSPELWIPHMTLAQFDLTRENQLDALKILMELDLELVFEVRNLTIFDWIGPKYEPRERYQLRGQAVRA